MPRKHTLLGLALLGLATTSAKAVLVTATFTATGFIPLEGSDMPPTDPVSGRFTYEAASLGATIDALVSISLTIDGHAYTLAETNFTSFGNIDVVYGSLNNTPVARGTNDFWIRFDPVAGTGFDVAYTSTSSATSYFQSSQFRNFSLSTAQAVPEPGTAALVSLALGASVWAGRRRAARPRARA